MKHAALFATMTLAVIGTAAEPVVQRPFPWPWKPADVRSFDLTELPPNLPMGDWRAAGIGQNVFASDLRFAWYRATLPADAGGAGKSLRSEAVDDGKCIVLVGRTDRPGTLTLRATSPGLKPAKMTLSVVRAR
jgi:hypothetical protein